MFRTFAVVCASILFSCLFPASTPAAADPRWPFRNVRPVDRELGVLILRGAAGSPTFRALVGAIERSDVIVHIERANESGGGLAGSTRFVTRAGGRRYIRITLYGLWSANHAIALIGHELQHASELASAGWVIDQQTCLELFRAIGHRTCDVRRVCFDTEAALFAGHQVWFDLLRQPPGE